MKRVVSLKRREAELETADPTEVDPSGIDKSCIFYIDH